MSNKVVMENPFGDNVKTRDAMEILKHNFGIGICSYDRGYKVWDENRVDERTGEKKPGWVHKSITSLECVVEFSVNEGKGTGRQIIPVDEFKQYVSVLRDIINNDYKEARPDNSGRYIPTYEIARESFAMVHPRRQIVNSEGKTVTEEDYTQPKNIVSVRVTSGKGAKPMLISKPDFEQLVSKFEGVVANLDAHVQKSWELHNNANGKSSDDETETSST